MNGAEVTPARPAGFWIRLVAFVIDGVVIMLAQFLLGFIAALRWGADVESRAGFQSGVVAFTFVFAVAYPTALHAVAGQTIGKMLVGVRVVGLNGERLPLGTALLRAIVHWVALVFAFGLGHLMAGLRQDRRALHDLLAGSRAERTSDRGRVLAPPPPVSPPPSASTPVM